MEVDHGNVKEGLRVLGTDGETVGKVKEIQATDFLVDRPMERDVYVPFGSVQAVTDNGVVLNISSDEVDEMDWPHRSRMASIPII